MIDAKRARQLMGLGITLWVWHAAAVVHIAPWSPAMSFAEKWETDNAILYHAGPREVTGSQEQRLDEQRREAASWEMLRRLTIEIDPPQKNIPDSNPPFPFQRKPKP